MARGLCKPFDAQAYLEGHMTPVFFGSAVNNFGVRELLEGLGRFAPPPRPQKAEERMIDPAESKVTGFVFKIQANMDPKHRDRIAFTRLCSGHFKKGMKLLHGRSGKQVVIHNPLMFLAQDRETAEEAFPGDIIGIPNHGNLSIGDALTEGETLHFTGIPSFAPELMQRARPDDRFESQTPVRRAPNNWRRRAWPGFSSRRLIQTGSSASSARCSSRFWPISHPHTEYSVPVKFEEVNLYTARWLFADDPAKCSWSS